MLWTVVVASVVALASGRPPRGEELTLDYGYAEYLRDFGKREPADWAAGEAVYLERLHQIVAHNRRADKTYVKGVNHLTDVARVPKGRAKAPSPRSYGLSRGGLGFVVEPAEKLPKRLDWREKGVVTTVKDQGGCGSCWAFATTATMESHIALATGTLFDLSPQELVACMPNAGECGGTGGCGGATAELAFDYYIKRGGVVQEYQMGYTSYYGKEGACYIVDYDVAKRTEREKKASSDKEGPDPPGVRGGVATIEAFATLPANDYLALLNAVHKVGPIAVSVDAAWADYESGVFTADTYDAVLDHAVVLVGYGVDGDLPYWLIRNSWSPTWGEGGYIRLYRHTVESPCGVDTRPLDGVGCKGGPANQTVCGTSGVLSDSSYPIGGHLI